jgi:arylsulfatase A-like enzyme
MRGGSMSSKRETPHFWIPIMQKRLFLFLALLCLAAVPFSDAADKPNVILILVDDHGYGDLSCYGATDLKTPHLDKLMASGMRFDQFYANCTVCTPTRAAMLTGRYPDLVGAPGVIRQSPKSNWGYWQPTGPTFPEMMKTGGYHTGMVGKWHLGYESPNIPNDRGFEFFHGFLGDMMDNYWKHTRGGKNWMRHNRDVIDPDDEHATEIFTRWGIDYVKEQAADKSKPFFLYLAYNAPHFPIQPPKDWLEKVKKREPQLDKKRAANVAFVEHTDHEIGKVLTAVKDLGIEKDTIIIFTSDNGGSIPHAQRNLPLRGGKQEHWEGGIRVPTCVVWPGKIKPGQRSNEPGMGMDFMPTIADIAGIPIEHEIDGASLKDIWLNGGKSNPNRTMIWVRREGNRNYQGRAYYAIRQGKWKLFQNTPFEPMKLVDLEADMTEKNPQPAKGKVADQLMNELMVHIQKAGKTPWQKPTDK